MFISGQIEVCAIPFQSLLLGQPSSTRESRVRYYFFISEVVLSVDLARDGSGMHVSLKQWDWVTTGTNLTHGGDSADELSALSVILAIKDQHPLGKCGCPFSAFENGVLIIFLVTLSHYLRLHTLESSLSIASLEIEFTKVKILSPAIAPCLPAFSAVEPLPNSKALLPKEEALTRVPLP